eukprot:TRINITY_DN31870_c0_g1_i1.p2 TRINITY_DN31870_c0_g1~~TRINITY_DN31870_c0_g1_i1.p2  ORF type:complete len:457 (-),score=97.81 TRINITY_DN31870_c0_g1_i1:82-1452(-)
MRQVRLWKKRSAPDFGCGSLDFDDILPLFRTGPILLGNGLIHQHDGNFVLDRIHHGARGAGQAVLAGFERQHSLAFGAGKYVQQFFFHSHGILLSVQAYYLAEPQLATTGRQRSLPPPAGPPAPGFPLYLRPTRLYIQKQQALATHNKTDNMSIDLHTHTTASDGTLSPTELVKLAKETGLDAIAITDHDTFQGVEEALEAGKKYGVEVIPGTELSLESPEGAGWIHVVALWLPPEADALQKAYDWVQEGRANRNHEIVDKLRSLGVNITYEKVAARAKGTIGRPHFAQEMMALGVVSSMDEAFKVWLGDNGRAYVPKRKLTPKQAFLILNDIGATSILAHPFALNLNYQKTEDLVRDLMKLGLDGMEVYYTEHTDADTKAYGEMADRLGLLKSGGSDFHGTNKPKIRLGVGKGSLHVPSELLEKMKQDRQSKGLPVQSPSRDGTATRRRPNSRVF